MRMDMVTVRVGCHHDFIAKELLLCEPQSDFVGSLRCQVFLRVERLQELIVHPAIGFAVEPLGVKKFPESILRNTVHTGDQTAALVFCFVLPAAVLQGSPEAAAGLGFLRCDKFDQCQRLDLLPNEGREAFIHSSILSDHVIQIHRFDSAHIGKGSKLV